MFLRSANGTARSLYASSADVSVKVRRDGKMEKIKQSELVAGDIVYFETGDKIPVDCRLINSENFSVAPAPTQL